MFETGEARGPGDGRQHRDSLKQDGAQGKREGREGPDGKPAEGASKVVMKPEQGAAGRPTLLAFFMGAAGLEQGPESVETVEEPESPASP